MIRSSLSRALLPLRPLRPSWPARHATPACPLVSGVRPFTLATTTDHYDPVADLESYRPIIPPRTAEEELQWDQWQWHLVRYNLYSISVFVGGVALVVYFWNAEMEHFHHRKKPPPYSYHIKRDDQVASGYWPGRSCQFFEFNCFANAYKAADELLAKKKKALAEKGEASEE